MINARHPISARAFTLMEVMLALGIFAVVLAAINMVFFSGLRLRNRATEVAEQALPTDYGVSTLQRDLAAIVPPNTNNPDALVGAMSSDTTSPGINGPVALEIFTASAIISDDKPWGDIQKIDYALQIPTNRNNYAGRDLVRCITRNLLATAADPPEQQTLLEDVQNLKFTYFDGTNWLDTWSVTLSNIPQAIKVAIDFAGRSGEAAVRPSIKLMVPVIIQGLTNQSMVATN